MNIASFLKKSSLAWANRPAIAHGTNIVQTYNELGSNVRSLAGAMSTKLGLERGDRVGIAMRNCTDYATVLFASWHAGLVAVPMNAKLHSREFEFIAP